ncbi:malonate--CoA ligase [Rhizobium straminoryzae]|uniref:Malonyl-CoA synthase n=1 Tax=Rhizobium straminoryzae TaxID=1387186 RepID=A0A549TDR2_9HYPH|nr:malonyl-CoA synthase [Rhizobium straminoryzae]TRL40225.1 malonyl-CoA synthase [Rhizobium straminoryzae]
MPNPLYDTLFAPGRDSDGAFLIDAKGEVLRYRDFHALAARQANVLVAAGLRAGDRLAVQVEKTPQALALYAACVMAGIVLLPLNTAYTLTELDYFIGDSGARGVICSPGIEVDLKQRCGADVMVLTLDGDGRGSLSDAADGQSGIFAVAEREESDLAALLYTSGTTGRSKGAMLTHLNLLSNARTLAELWRFGSRDVLLHALPIFHTHGLFVACNVTLMAQASMIFLPKFDLPAMLRLLPDASVLMGVPTFYTRLLGDDRFNRDLVAHMRLFVSGSAPLLAETHVEFEARTGHRILERYGMTETNMSVSNPYEGERRAGTVGFPLPDVDLLITDPETGTVLPVGETGMIEVRGPNVFKGYWGMPEKTKAELRDNGFFITGDIGRIDPGGYVQIVGRAKDLIISGGLNIYPREIEMLLDEQPGVLESAVVGVPHPDFGEAVLAFLVPRPGATLDLSAITRTAADNLARFKQPRELIVIEELPRNTMGKVQKAALREACQNRYTQ